MKLQNDYIFTSRSANNTRYQISAQLKFGPDLLRKLCNKNKYYWTLEMQKETKYSYGLYKKFYFNKSVTVVNYPHSYYISY